MVQTSIPNAPVHHAKKRFTNRFAVLRRQFGCIDRWRFYLWKQLGLRRDFQASIKSGIQLVIRQRPAGDLAIAWEIFGDQVYQCPWPLDPAIVQTVVDVGGNVGYSILHWAREFPACKILTLEPHPEHLQQMTRHLELNGLLGRVQIIPAAAGISNTTMFLTDAGGCSTIIDPAHKGNHRGFDVPVVDFFKAVEGRRIDLLKIDIEGGEFSLLEDPRFVRLDIQMLVMEWHKTEIHPQPVVDVVACLRAAGLKDIIETRTKPDAGMLWAKRAL